MNIFQKIPIQANILTFLFFHNLSLLFPEDSQETTIFSGNRHIFIIC